MGVRTGNLLGDWGHWHLGLWEKKWTWEMWPSCLCPSQIIPAAHFLWDKSQSKWAQVQVTCWAGRLGETDSVGYRKKSGRVSCDLSPCGSSLVWEPITWWEMGETDTMGYGKEGDLCELWPSLVPVSYLLLVCCESCDVSKWVWKAVTCSVCVCERESVCVCVCVCVRACVRACMHVGV